MNVNSYACRPSWLVIFGLSTLVLTLLRVLTIDEVIDGYRGRSFLAVGTLGVFAVVVGLKRGEKRDGNRKADTERERRRVREGWPEWAVGEPGNYYGPEYDQVGHFGGATHGRHDLVLLSSGDPVAFLADHAKDCAGGGDDGPESGERDESHMGGGDLRMQGWER